MIFNDQIDTALRANPSGGEKDLLGILDLSFNNAPLCSRVGGHCCSGGTSPILGARVPRGGSNVSVTHLAHNGSSYICAVTFETSIHPTVLGPISALLRERSPSSHQAPDGLAITDYSRSYVQNEPLSGFSFQASDRFQIAVALRYLDLVSTVDHDLQTGIFPNRNRSTVPHIDILNPTDRAKTALRKIGVTFEGRNDQRGNQFDFMIGDNALLSACSVRPVISPHPHQHQAIVAIELAEGAVLPALPSLPEVMVRLADTAITDKVSSPGGNSWNPNLDLAKDAIESFPARLLGASAWNNKGVDDGFDQFLRMTREIPYPVMDAVAAVRPGTRHFSFLVPNMLDGLLLGFMLHRAIEPVVNTLRPRSTAQLGALIAPSSS